MSELSHSANIDEPTDDLCGSILDDKLEIRSLLGKGAHGTVYKAYHRLLNQFVAVKTLNANPDDPERAEKRFLNEANLLSGFSHENIVRFHSFGKMPDGRHYMVLEYLEGRTLEQVLQEKGVLCTALAVDFFMHICNGLSYAHAKGIIHRDLKPGNIMICKSNEGEQVKLLDFGIFKELESKNQALTRTGAFLGSMNYMSPEQCKLFPLDARSDIYSFGCLAYETLVGNPPMQDANDVMIMSNHVNKEIKAVPAKNGISRDLEKLILRCLNKRPEDRFASADELLKVLKTCEEKLGTASGSKRKMLLSILLGAAVLTVPAYLLLAKPDSAPRVSDKSASVAAIGIATPRNSREMLAVLMPNGAVRSEQNADAAEVWMEKYRINTIDDSMHLAILYVACKKYRMEHKQKPGIENGEKIRHAFKRHKHNENYDKKWAEVQAFYINFMAAYKHWPEAFAEMDKLTTNAPQMHMQCCQAFYGLLDGAAMHKLKNIRDKALKAFQAYAEKYPDDPYIQASYNIKKSEIESADSNPEAERKALKTACSKLAEAVKEGFQIEPTHISHCCKRLQELKMSPQLIELVQSTYGTLYPGFEAAGDTQKIDANVQLIKRGLAQAYINQKEFDKAIAICNSSKKQFLTQLKQDKNCDHFEQVLLLAMKEKALSPNYRVLNWKDRINDEAFAYLEQLRDLPDRLPTACERILLTLAELDISPETVWEQIQQRFTKTANRELKFNLNLAFLHTMQYRYKERKTSSEKLFTLTKTLYDELDNVDVSADCYLEICQQMSDCFRKKGELEHARISLNKSNKHYKQASPELRNQIDFLKAELMDNDEKKIERMNQLYTRFKNTGLNPLFCACLHDLLKGELEAQPPKIKEAQELVLSALQEFEQDKQEPDWLAIKQMRTASQEFPENEAKMMKERLNKLERELLQKHTEQQED